MLKKLSADAGPEVREKVAADLGDMALSNPHEALVLVGRLIEDSNIHVQDTAGASLISIGRSYPGATVKWFKSVENPSLDLRGRMAEALIAMGGGSPDIALDEVYGLIDDPNSEVRKKVSDALGEIGKTNAAGALELLDKLSSDSNFHVRERVSGALGMIGGSSPDGALKILEKLMDDDSSYVKERVID